MADSVALRRSEEGYSVTVPGLPGCCSQGATEAEALANSGRRSASTSLSRPSWLLGPGDRVERGEVDHGAAGR
jgi:hypothetical protein